MNQLVTTWRNLDNRRRMVLVGAVVLTFLAVLSLARIATRPGLALLYSGLDPAAAGEVVGALEQMNVSARVQGDAIYVPEDARDRVRLALAREGLPRQGQGGYELLDKLSGFSATADMFNAAYWRAKEGELARTILSSPGVRAARVHIAMPNRQTFRRNAARPTASATVTMAGGSLTNGQAMAVRYLVALAVPRLDPAQVAVIDSRAGVVLAPGKDNQFTTAQSQASEREAKLKGEIEQLLAARVGRDKARVSVSVETHRAAEKVVEKILKPDSRVTLNSETTQIKDNSKGSNGKVTVASNLPDGAAKAKNDRESSRNESRERVNYRYSEVRRETVRQAGAIRRISVAVLVDGISRKDAAGATTWVPRPKPELEALRQLVIAAIGYDKKRGDIVTVDSMPFKADPRSGALVEANPLMRFLERNAMTLIQLGVLAAVAVILALTVIRPLLRRSAAGAPGAAPALAAPDGTGESAIDDRAASLPAADQAGGSGGRTDGSPDGELGFDLGTTETPPQDALRSIAAERPEETAEMLKLWLVEGQAEEEAAA